MREIDIKSRLVGRENLFQILALAYSTGHACLLQGIPGVAKSHAVKDFITSVYPNQPDLVFDYQLNDFTKDSDITGRVDIEALVQEKKFQYVRDICNAYAVIIDEVGRGSSSIRAAMLDIMNEKRIKRGRNSCDLVWKLFVGMTNFIPEEEVGNAFWDN